MDEKLNYRNAEKNQKSDFSRTTIDHSQLQREEYLNFINEKF